MRADTTAAPAHFRRPLLPPLNDPRVSWRARELARSRAVQEQRAAARAAREAAALARPGAKPRGPQVHATGDDRRKVADELVGREWTEAEARAGNRAHTAVKRARKAGRDVEDCTDVEFAQHIAYRALVKAGKLTPRTGELAPAVPRALALLEAEPDVVHTLHSLAERVGVLPRSLRNSLTTQGHRDVSIRLVEASRAAGHRVI